MEMNKSFGREMSIRALVPDSGDDPLNMFYLYWISGDLKKF